MREVGILGKGSIEGIGELDQVAGAKGSAANPLEISTDDSELAGV